MHYKVVVFGVKDTSENIIRFIHSTICPVDLVVTISKEVLSKNKVSGFKGLTVLEDELGIEVHEISSYGMKDESTLSFFRENTFDIGISMGWQRLIPGEVLNQFQFGVYGFHGSCGYLPYGRGRSPLNWSIILGDTRFNLNLFQYDEKADSPNVFQKEMFEINPHDTIRTLQYKNMICSKRLIRKLLTAYQNGSISVNSASKDFDSWYEKRTAEDGMINFQQKTRDIYNLIRGVTAPFPGAFVMCDGIRMIIWDAVPFDEMLDFSEYTPGEIIDIFDGQLVVRTIDGSLLIRKYECKSDIKIGSILR